jgi:hypothetical protein
MPGHVPAVATMPADAPDCDERTLARLWMTANPESPHPKQQHPTELIAAEL